MLPLAGLLIRGIPTGWVASGHDANFAISLQRLYTDELLHGHAFPIRWLRDGNEGFGSPVFYFYPQLAYLAGAAWQVLLHLPPDRAMVLTLTLARTAAFASAYLWLRLRVRSVGLAAFGAALFLLAPHITLGLNYQRFLFAESAATMWVPTVLLVVDAPLSTWKRVLLGAPVFALLALTHVPETVLLGILVVVYALACYGMRRAAEVVGAGTLGAAMGAVGLVPAFMLRDWTDLAGWSAWYFQPYYTALFSPYTFPQGILLDHVVELVLLATWFGALGCAVALTWIQGIRHMGRRDRGLLVTLLAVLLATTWAASPIWMAVPVLRDVQFPWRYLQAASLLAAAALAMAARGRPKLSWVLVASVAALAIGQAAIPFAEQLLPERVWLGERGRLPQFVPLSGPISTARMAEAARASDTDPPEYVPAQAHAAGWHANRELLKAVPVGVFPVFRAPADALPERDAHLRLKPVAVITGQAAVSVTDGSLMPGGLLTVDADVSSPEGATVRIPQFFWPAMRVRGRGVTLGTDPATGLVLMHLPPDRSVSVLRIVVSKPDRLGRAVSVAGIVAWVAGLSGLAWTNRQRIGQRQRA